MLLVIIGKSPRRRPSLLSRRKTTSPHSDLLRPVDALGVRSLYSLQGTVAALVQPVVARRGNPATVQRLQHDVEGLYRTLQHRGVSEHEVGGLHRQRSLLRLLAAFQRQPWGVIPPRKAVFTRFPPFTFTVAQENDTD